MSHALERICSFPLTIYIYILCSISPLKGSGQSKEPVQKWKDLVPKSKERLSVSEGVQCCKGRRAPFIQVAHY